MCVEVVWIQEKKKDEQLVKKMVGSDVTVVVLTGRLWTGWMDGVKRVLNERGMSVE